MSDKTQFSCDYEAKNHKICCHDIFPYSWKDCETSGNGRIFSFACLKNPPKPSVAFFFLSVLILAIWKDYKNSLWSQFIEGFSRNPEFGVWNVLFIWVEELNQESKSGLC